MNTSNWLKEPLLHFLVLGALVFAFYNAVSGDAPGDDEIVVTRGVQEHLVRGFSRAWQRPPTQSEFNGIVDDWIREEIAYREGIEMSLDTDDTVIRRRLRQKMEMLAEDIVSLAEPTEEDLQTYLEQNQAKYLAEPEYTLRQIYFSGDRRGEAVMQDAEQALLLLTTGPKVSNPETMGDPFSLPHRYVREPRRGIEAAFGRAFADSLAELEHGTWQGPVRSGYGLHLVLIEDFVPGGPLTLEDAEREVRRDWENERRIEAINTLYDRLGERYTITVEPVSTEGSPAS
jgi:hypothetical protein